TRQALEAVLPPYWTRKNPIDLNYDATPELYAQALEILDQDPDITNVLVMYAPSLTQDSLKIANAVIAAAKRTRLNVLTCWLGQSTVMDARAAFYQAGLPTYFTPDKAVKAFMHHVNHERSQRLLKETPTTHTDHMVDRERARDIIRTACARKRSYLSHGEARELVQCYGIPTLNTRYCDDEDEVVEAHRSLGRPVNLTVLHQASCSPFMEEASGRGRYHGTVRWLNEEEALRRSCQVLLEQYRRHYPHSGFLGFAVQEAF